MKAKLMNKPQTITASDVCVDGVDGLDGVPEADGAPLEGGTSG